MNLMLVNNDDPFGDSHRIKRLNFRSVAGPNPLRRIIGAVCGGFVLCFLSILLSLPFLAKIDLVTTNVIWGLAFLLGTIGGFLLPGVGQLLAYAFLIFMNVMLSFAIGRNIREQILLFLIFAVVEFLYLAARYVSRSSH
ncbi:MAG: hypothetical protein GY904_28390 [Planctomycetaceae bacterium]|nr:hypothetical protein [Planctomycetaceae bacterium]